MRSFAFQEIPTSEQSALLKQPSSAMCAAQLFRNFPSTCFLSGTERSACSSARYSRSTRFGKSVLVPLLYHAVLHSCLHPGGPMSFVRDLKKTHRITALLALAIIGLMTPARAQAIDTVSSRPGTPQLPVTFQIDCSHLSDPATRQLCRPFIQNQACKGFPPYPAITGLKFEDRRTPIN